MKTATSKQRAEMKAQWLKGHQRTLGAEWLDLAGGMVIDFLTNGYMLEEYNSKVKLRDSFKEFCNVRYVESEAQYLIQHNLCIY